jgi:hypothetical protein
MSTALSAIHGTDVGNRNRNEELYSPEAAIAAQYTRERKILGCMEYPRPNPGAVANAEAKTEEMEAYIGGQIAGGNPVALAHTPDLFGQDVANRRGTADVSIEPED